MQGVPILIDSMKKFVMCWACNIGNIMEFTPDDKSGGKDAPLHV